MNWTAPIVTLELFLIALVIVGAICAAIGYLVGEAAGMSSEQRKWQQIVQAMEREKTR